MRIQLSHQSSIPEVTIELRDSREVYAVVRTERLVISPASQSDVQDYHRFLFADPSVMEKFATGVVRNAEFVQGRIATWESRRKSGDPFCGFAIRTREGEFVGHIVLGHGEKAGHAELAYLIRADYWNKGYGTEAANGIVNGLAPLLKTYDFKMRKEEQQSTGEKRISVEGIQVIDATARPDNPASGAILRRLGLDEIGIQDAHGAPREHFSGQVPCASSDSAWAILVMPGLTIFKD